MDQETKGKEEISSEVLLRRALATAEGVDIKTLISREPDMALKLLVELKSLKARRNHEKRRLLRVTDEAFSMRMMLRDIADLLSEIRHRLTVQEYLALAVKLNEHNIEF